MLGIDIKKVDRLSEITMKLSAITLLQGFISGEEYISYVKEYECVFGYTRCILYEQQKKTVFELKELIESEDFTEKTSKK